MNRRMHLAVLIAVASMALSGCRDSTAPKINLTGNWTDVLPDGRIVALFLQDNNGSITGDGFIGNSDITAIQGTLSGSDITATLTMAAGAVQLAGLATTETIAADLNGPGFNGTVVVLER